MFRAELQAKLSRIFGLKKTTYDAPSDSFEQDTLFIDIQECRSNASQGKITAQVRGTLTVYSQQNKLPFGFFNKRIGQAKFEDTKNIFFSDIDTDVASSPARTQNISERRCGFLFLYSAQHDPSQGTLNQLEFNEETA